jgi:hypothetical protein
MNYILYSVLLFTLFYGLFQDSIEHLSRGGIKMSDADIALWKKEMGITGDVVTSGKNTYLKSKWNKPLDINNNLKWQKESRANETKEYQQKQNVQLHKEGAIRGILLPNKRISIPSNKKKITNVTNIIKTKNNSTKNIILMVILFLLLVIIILIITSIVMKKN